MAPGLRVSSLVSFLIVTIAHFPTWNGPERLSPMGTVRTTLDTAVDLVVLLWGQNAEHLVGCRQVHRKRGEWAEPQEPQKDGD